jgi:hypothetical protein
MSSNQQSSGQQKNVGQSGMQQDLNKDKDKQGQQLNKDKDQFNKDKDQFNKDNQFNKDIGQQGQGQQRSQGNK